MVSNCVVIYVCDFILNSRPWNHSRDTQSKCVPVRVNHDKIAAVYTEYIVLHGV